MTARSRFINRKRFVAASVLVVVMLGLTACGSGGESMEASPPPQREASSSADSSEVVMRLIAYKPDALTVPTETSVTWTQQDAGFHTVTSGTVSKDATGSAKTNTDGTFESGQLAKGENYSFTFTEPGTYEYFCEVHPATMTGKVTAK